jgi:hypothetical protein
MPIEISCPGCNRRMHVPDAAAGRQVKCPGCQTSMLVQIAAPVTAPLATPLAAASQATARPAPVARPMPAAARPMPQMERWTLLTEDQQQFGPITRPELDQWYSEGRITQGCQLLREGGSAWQWAQEIYPALAAPLPAAGPFDFNAAPAVTPTKSASSVSRFTRKSAAVEYVAYACFAVVGMVTLRILMMGLMQHEQLSNRFSARVAGPTLAIYYVIAFLFAFIVLTPYGLAGLAVSARKQWGRILCFVAAAFSVLFGLISGVSLILGLLLYASVSSRMPDEAHGTVPFGFMMDGLVTFCFVAHAGLTFIVLTQSRFAKEFR